MDNIIEDSVLMADEEKEYVQKFIYEIPFYLRPVSTSSKFPYFGHRLSCRPYNENDFDSNSQINIDSNHFNFFINLIDRFCEKYKLKYKNIIRSFINSTFYVEGYEHTDPHVDCYSNHIVVLIYLSKESISSNTIVYEKTQNYDGIECMIDIDSLECKTLKVKKEITPDYGKIVAFDGKYFHSNRLPIPGENRIVCVFNLLI